MRRRGRVPNAVLIALALTPVGALGLIVGGPLLRSKAELTGSFNGTPFQMRLSTSRLSPAEAVREAESEFIARGGSPNPDFRPWEGLAGHPMVRDAMADLIPGRLVIHRDGSVAAAFAMPRAQSEGGGSMLGILETRGPLKPRMAPSPGGPLLEIRYGPILARQYAPQDREDLIESLEHQGWGAELEGNQPWTVFHRDGWNGVASREGSGAWTFFAFSDGGK